MPIAPAVLAAGIQGGTSILNAVSQGMQNRKNRKFAEKMYDRQRADALADRDYQNLYNSPAEQMKRLKAGGLNPNLVYGDGATTTAAPVRSSDYKQPDTRAPQLDSSAVGTYFDAKLKEAQTNNVEQAIKVAIETAALTAARTKQQTLESGQYQSLMPVTLDTAEAKLNKLYADTRYTLDQNERQALLNAQTLKKGVEEILNLRLSRAKTSAEIQNIKLTAVNLRNTDMLQKEEIRLQKLGLKVSDPAYIKAIGNLLDKASKSKPVQGATDALKYAPSGSTPFPNFFNF